MYRLIKNNRKTIISSDEVIAASATDNNVEPRQLDAAIQIAEERFVKGALCKDLYYDFRDKKNVIVTVINKAFLESEMNDGNTGDAVILLEGDIVNAIEFVTNPYYLDLWYEHLWKICAESAMYTASPTNFSRFTASGEMENNPKTLGMEGKNAASVDLAKMQWKMDKMMQDRIDPLIAAMDEWLFDNRGHFPLLNCKKYPYFDKNIGISIQRKTAWIHGIYDTGRENNCYPCNRDQL